MFVVKALAPTTCVISNSIIIKRRGSKVYANKEVSLVQQEIPVSKMPSYGIGSNPTGWPEVALANSGHK